MIVKVSRFGLIIFLLSFCYFKTIAQPLGDEPQRIKAQAQNLLDQIKLLDVEIKSNLKDSDLYGKRGFLRIELLEMLYGGSYLSNFYKNKPTELSVESLATEAIEDFSKAIKISPKFEFYAGRGKMYSARWFVKIKKLNWYEETQKINPPTKREKLLITQKDKELLVFKKFFTNPDFTAAEKDFNKALKLNGKSDLADQLRQELAKMYMERSNIFFFNMKETKDFLISKKKYNYSALDDLNKAIFHVLNMNNFDAETQSVYKRNHSEYQYYHKFDNYPFSPVDLYYRKAFTEETYGFYKHAVESLDSAEMYFKKFPPTKFFLCKFYSDRSRIYNELEKFDAALEDADKAYAQSDLQGYVCYYAQMPSANAYFGKGFYQQAVSKYSDLIQLNYHPDTDVLIIAHKYRGLAYLKLKIFENAVSDLSYFLKNISYSGLSNEFGYDEQIRQEIEIIKIRAEIYRQTGDIEKALKDEKTVKHKEWYLARRFTKRIVYGEIVDSNNKIIKGKDIQINLTYTEPSFDSTLSYKQDGRNFLEDSKSGEFTITDLPDSDFYISAYIDTERNGKPIRLFGKTSNLNVRGQILGPVKIILDRIVERPNNK